MGKAQALRSALTLVGDAVAAAILDPRCAACARALERPHLGPVCSWCWDEARRSAGNYDGALQQIIHALKYDGHTSLARPLAEMLRAREPALLSGADCVVPVPLFPVRRLRRGFNQAALIAAHLGPPVASALWRVRPTATQTGLTAAERRRNVQAAFRLSPLLTAAQRDRWVTGRVVVLVDDVMTTGATLAACARALDTAGARDIRVLTAARAVLRD